jgi:hypothetical protein
MKIPVVSLPEFVLYLEEDNGFTFIHCDVLTKWSKEIKKKLKEVFKEITASYNQELYALHDPEDRKHKKFLELFDFNYFTSITGTDGNSYEIYVWR